MNIKLRKIYSCLISLMIVLSLVSTSAFISVAKETEETEENKIKLTVDYGKGAIVKVSDLKYRVEPDKGYRLWRLVPYTKFLDRLEIKENDSIYAVPDDTDILTAYFISNEEYNHILEVAKSEDNLKYFWDNPKWFFKYGLNTLDNNAYNEIYGEYTKLQTEKNEYYNTANVSRLKFDELSDYNIIPLNNSPFYISGFSIMSVPDDYVPQIGDHFSGSATGDGSNQGKLSGYTFTFNDGWLAGADLGLNCVQQGEWYPVGAGTYSGTVTSIGATTFNAEITWTPNDSRAQTCIGTATLTYNAKGKLKLKKSSSNPSISNGNSCYSLAGAKYNVYSDANCTTLVGEFITDSNGNSTTELELVQGTYYVKETKAPKGYGLNSQKYSITVTSNQTITVQTQDPPQVDPVDIALKKTDKETGEPYPLEAGALKGAKYIYKYYDNYDFSGTPKAQWTFKTDDNGRIRLLENYLDSDSNNSPLYRRSDGFVTFPVGSITIQEIKAPEGYLIDDTIYKFKIEAIDNNAVARDEHGNMVSIINVEVTPIVPEQSKRGDYKFNKIRSDTQRPIANCVFKITAKETGESHMIMTDDNGFWSSEASYIKHSINTNTGTASSGTWFGMDSKGHTTSPNDDKGAFPFGEYEFAEQECESNHNLNLITFSMTISRDDYTVDGGTKTDDPIQPLEISTYLREDEDTKEIVPDMNTELYDEVTIDGMNEEQEYTLYGVIVEKSTKEQITTNIMHFMAEATDGVYENRFVLDTRDYVGKRLVCFEYLYEGTLEESELKGLYLIGKHESITDQNQTIKVMDIDLETKLTDEDGDKEISPDKETVLVDKVYYSPLVKKQQYTLFGKIVLKETGEVLATSINTFKYSKVSDNIDMKYKLDTTKYEGKKLVCFEYLYKGDLKENELDYTEPFVKHVDIEDQQQTVTVKTIPKIVKQLIKTGDNKLILFMVLVFILITSTFFVIRIKRKNKKLLLNDNSNKVESNINNKEE